MSNHVYCSLQVPAQLAEKVEAIIEDWAAADNYLVGIKRYDFEEVLHGENQWREQLIAAGIPFVWNNEDSDRVFENCVDIRYTPKGHVIEHSTVNGTNWKSMAHKTIAMCNNGKSQNQIIKYMYRELCKEFIIKLNEPSQIDYGQRSATLALVLQNEVPEIAHTPRYMIPKKVRRQWLNWGIKNELHSNC